MDKASPKIQITFVLYSEELPALHYSALSYTVQLALSFVCQKLSHTAMHCHILSYIAKRCLKAYTPEPSEA